MFEGTALKMRNLEIKVNIEKKNEILKREAIAAAKIRF